MILDNLIIKFGASPWNPRGKYRLYKILAAAVGTVQGVTPRGVRLKFRADDATGYFFFRKDYEEQLTDLIAALPPGGIFVDVGANMGNYALMASRQVGNGGLVVAFEPVAETFGLLTHHRTINGATNLLAINAAVAAGGGMVDMVVFEDSGGSYIGKIDRADYKRAERVATVSLDSFLPPVIGNREIDLLKIDVEGAEFGVLRGAERLLDSRKIRQIHVEVFPSDAGRAGAVAREEFWAFLETRGYKPRFRRTEDVMYDEIFDRL